MLSTNWEIEIQIVVIRYLRNSIITGSTVFNMTGLSAWHVLYAQETILARQAKNPAVVGETSLKSLMLQLLEKKQESDASTAMT